MSKVIGGIFFVIGFIMLAVLIFLYMNSSAFLNYNDPAKHLSLFETGLAAPFFLFGLMFTVGLVFLFFGKEPRIN
ncbi:MAG: hypothetical protein U0T84_02635 [Chitinophagales bacterium]